MSACGVRIDRARSDGRVAVITGASSGVGEATARRLAAGGTRVALLARRRARVDALARELGERALAIRADVTDRDSLLEAAGLVRAQFGRADILINNAGISLVGSFGSERREDHRRMVETNLMGAMTVTEVFLDQLRDGGGDVVNISSLVARSPSGGGAVYAATKCGLSGWSEALRQELQPDIRVIVISPGAVDTELPDHMTDAAMKPGIEEFYRRFALPAEDVSDIIAFAISRPRNVSVSEILVRPTADPS